MAGRGPAPSASRQRRNVPQRGDWVKLEPLASPVLPELGELGPAPGDPDLGWPFSTRTLWEAWRADPVTATWNGSDLAFCIDTILLHAVSAVSKSNEVRLRMESLGLTPKGRRDLRFLLPDEDAAQASEKLAKVVPLRRVLPEAK